MSNKYITNIKKLKKKFQTITTASSQKEVDPAEGILVGKIQPKIFLKKLILNLTHTRPKLVQSTSWCTTGVWTTGSRLNATRPQLLSGPRGFHSANSNSKIGLIILFFIQSNVLVRWFNSAAIAAAKLSQPNSKRPIIHPVYIGIYSIDNSLAISTV